MVRQVMISEQYTSDDFSLGEHETVIDVGANIGSFAIYAGKRVKRVLAFEPAESAFSLLTQNVALNGLGNIESMRAALGSRTGEVVLYKGSDDALNTLYKDNASGKHGHETVRCITLSDVFANYALDRCHFLKLDCEGAEYDILYSASKEILSRIDRISMEYHVLSGRNEGQLVDELCGYLWSSAGFRVVRRVQYEGAGCGLLRFTRLS